MLWVELYLPKRHADVLTVLPVDVAVGPYLEIGPLRMESS